MDSNRATTSNIKVLVVYKVSEKATVGTQAIVKLTASLTYPGLTSQTITHAHTVNIISASVETPVSYF